MNYVRSKYNRVTQSYSKDHWIDAACAGETGKDVFIPQRFAAFDVKAKGRGNRQKCSVDRYGFPRTGPKILKRIEGFQTGDLIKAVITQGKNVGVHVGRVAVRRSGRFNINTGSVVIQGVSFRYCSLLQHVDGYCYS